METIEDENAPIQQEAKLFFERMRDTTSGGLLQEIIKVTPDAVLTHEIEYSYGTTFSWDVLWEHGTNVHASIMIWIQEWDVEAGAAVLWMESMLFQSDDEIFPIQLTRYAGRKWTVDVVIDQKADAANAKAIVTAAADILGVVAEIMKKVDSGWWSEEYYEAWN